MADPNQEMPAATVEEAGEKILSMMTPDQEEIIEESAEAAPEETTEEVAEETEEPEVKAEETEEPDDTFYSELNELLVDSTDQYERLKVKAKFNGVEEEVSLADLRDAYQINKNADHLADSLKSEREQFRQEKEAALAEANQQLNMAATLTQNLEQEFLKDYNNVNWEELRQQDPAEFSARKQEFLERQQGIQHAKESVFTTHSEAIKKEFQTKLQQESTKLPERIPEWSNQETATTEKKALREYLLSNDWTPAEIDGAVDERGNIVSPGIIDSRAIAIARKAMLYDQKQSEVEVTKKKVKKLPKVAKPGKPREKAEIDVERVKKLRGKLKTSGKVEDAADLIMDRMFGG